MSDDATFMRQALELAARGRGSVEPNPMVGAVIVRDGRVIASGYHQRFGGPHAEIVAIEAAKVAGEDPASPESGYAGPSARTTSGATIYVTLEPCCHFGKTPPCTDALIRAGFSRVVAAMLDPDERVAGKGVEILRQAGIEVTVGVLEELARELLAPYIKLRTHVRPWVICKWAQTADGFLALPAGQGRWISSPISRNKAHELRGRCQGILVGIGTVLADDPLLTNRSGVGGQPARVVLDARLRIPLDCQLVKSARQSPVIVATIGSSVRAASVSERTNQFSNVHVGGPLSDGRGSEKIAELRRLGVEVLELPAAERDAEKVSLPHLLDELGRRQWTYLLVEGGAAVHRSFLDEGLADELAVFVAPTEVGAGAGVEQHLPRLDSGEVFSRVKTRSQTEESSGVDRFVRCRIVR